ncbi:N-acetyllactosaminide alpha-1,3-galactosyltransferase [Orchesella cincta]|uniref:N-acetyllactosaminide alpha-1,3-galactosyltransferase n=1 Tax=Orchesella cincta TaxID=48709 RepID=A0A1D2MXT1_ORCCI|nr:N-acetyllactosaminide alpha-1,3-galactosyltransferase [Orchesella cincta]
MWATRVLCRPLRTYVSVNIPPGFKEAHREVFKEDPTVDLKKVLQQRILCIGSAVGATVRRNSPLHGEMMDILEEKLFKDSQESRIKLDDWLQPFELPPEVKEELRRPKPPPPSPPKQHHQQFYIGPSQINFHQLLLILNCHHQFMETRMRSYIKVVILLHMVP